jgi:hypothetical protein
MSLSGPRFGVSLVKGDNANRSKERFDVKPIVTQFGRQFETWFLSTTDGFAGLSEWYRWLPESSRAYSCQG